MNNWETKTKPEPGAWCWVTDGRLLWIAEYGTRYAGGWGNQDTWEDFGGHVIAWIEIPKPDLPDISEACA